MNETNFKIYLIIALSLILGLSTDYLFYGKPFGISFFVFTLGFIAFSIILAKKFGKRLNKNQIFLLLAILLLAAGVFLRSAPFLVFFNTIGALYLILLFFNLFLDKDLLNFNFFKYLICPFSFLARAFSKSARFIEKFEGSIQLGKGFQNPALKSALKGVIIAIPVLVVFISLFYSADLIVQKYIDSIWNINIDPAITIRTLLVLIFSYFFIGIFASAFSNKKPDFSPVPKRAEFKPLGWIESTVVLGSTEILFLFFIIIQSVYLFGGKTYVWGISEYITYSEYARKGFYELLAVAIFSLFLIYALEKLTKRETLKQKNLFKILNVVLVLEISVIMFSTFKRLSLYVDGYGLTFSRFFSFVFLFWLFSVFLLFLYCKIYSEKRKTKFLFSLFWLTILFWLGINLLNPDAFIAKKNIERLAQGKKLDAYYLNFLSNDAAPEIVKIFALKNKDEIKTQIAGKLHQRYNPPYNSPCNFYSLSETQCKWHSFTQGLQETREARKWQSFNLSHEKALEALSVYAEDIEEYHQLYLEELRPTK